MEDRIHIGKKFLTPGKKKTLGCPQKPGSQPPRRWHNSLLINRHGRKGDGETRWHAAMAGETTSELCSLRRSYASVERCVCTIDGVNGSRCSGGICDPGKKLCVKACLIYAWPQRKKGSFLVSRPTPPSSRVSFSLLIAYETASLGCSLRKS